MFAGFIKYLLAGLALFASYNEFITMRRDSAFKELVRHQDKASVANAIGAAKFTHHCGVNEQAPAFLTYIESLCTEGVTEVEAYPLCFIEPRCRGWNYVSFDKNGKLVNRYHYTN